MFLAIIGSSWLVLHAKPKLTPTNIIVLGGIGRDKIVCNTIHHTFIMHKQILYTEVHTMCTIRTQKCIYVYCVHT